VLASSKAHGEWSLLAARHAEALERELDESARRFGVRVYERANAGTHFHILALAPDRTAHQCFLRSFAGHSAQIVTGALRGHPVGRFWDVPVYTRLVTWGRDFRRVRSYIRQNTLEAQGLVPYRPRTARRTPVRK
jgi:hypothetical protein